MNNATRRCNSCQNAFKMFFHSLEIVIDRVGITVIFRRIYLKSNAEHVSIASYSDGILKTNTVFHLNILFLKGKWILILSFIQLCYTSIEDAKMSQTPCRKVGIINRNLLHIVVDTANHIIRMESSNKSASLWPVRSNLQSTCLVIPPKIRCIIHAQWLCEMGSRKCLLQLYDIWLIATSCLR